jgi:hypothetical protein
MGASRYRPLAAREPVYTEELATGRPSGRVYSQGYIPQDERIVYQQLTPGLHFSVLQWLFYTLMILLLGGGIGFVGCIIYIAHLRGG